MTLIPPVFSAPPGSDQGLGCGGGFGAIAEILCQKSDKATVGITLNKVVSIIIGFLTIVAALWFLFQFIIAGFQWIAAGGDKNNTAAARDKITNSLIGLMVIVIAWAVVGIVGKLLGLDILNPGAVLQTLGL
ncbi:hypothetical protein HZB96_02975 [Candidatus Gottesmanbacteria bacterium]|nr:hypothetical protein [Candidatus Gottesmanbacteria bacterium]